jgi:hypothetical protein
MVTQSSDKSPVVQLFMEHALGRHGVFVYILRRYFIRSKRIDEERNAMKLAPRWLSYTVATTFACALGMFSLVLAGGSDDEGPDAHVDAGPSYFGFVKDTSGKIVADAKVTAEIKGKGSVITRTDKTGAYKLPGFGTMLSPNQVAISCAKDGYKQTRTFTRTALNKKPLTAIEIECTMQRMSAR